MAALMTNLRETVSLDEAARRRWDVLVVGAGPAGALAARQLAKGGASVLLVDQARFPRFKVCGGCLNASALASLTACGLGDVPQQCDAPTLQRLLLGCGRSVATLALPAGAALSRTALDAALVREAIRAGAAFLPECTVRLGACDTNGRQCTLRRRADAARVHARVVVAASGVGGPLLNNEPPFSLHVRPDARIGAGAVLQGADDGYAIGSIYMACDRGGYVGLTRIEDNRLNVAAALDPQCVRQAGDVGAAIRSILEASPFPTPVGLDSARWRGTPPLTCRRRPVAAERVFLIGDATGYVEPFTGEGMA
ncbi:MAG: FAD-binding protein, partial [Planctomycetota bacterium]